MDLHYLEIFHTVAKYSSFKQASAILHISQPALSIQVKKLESQTGLKLFDKIGNRIHLSDSGLMLYEYTKRIFSIMEEMENSITNYNEFIGGTINLGGSNTPGTYLLPAVIGEMKKSYPGITINLHIADTSEITALIDNGTLDIAVNGGNCSYSSNIEVEKLMDDMLVIVASPGNQLSQLEFVDIADLLKEDYVVHNITSQLYSYFKTFIDEYDFSPNISMYCGNIDAMKHAVYADLGISIVPYYAVKLEIEMGLLKELKMQKENIKYAYSLIYNKNKHLTTTTKKFIEILKQVFSNL